MALSDRARSTVMFALAVAAAQAGCLLAMWLLSFIRWPEYPRKGAGAGVFNQFAMFALLLAVPAIMYNGRVGRRWPPYASRQATVVVSMIGLTVGFVVGGLLAENGYLPSWVLGTRAGAVVGSFVALTLQNLFASGAS